MLRRYKSGGFLMGAGGSYFNPQHTPLEDFLISDGAVSLNDLSVNGLMNNYW